MIPSPEFLVAALVVVLLPGASAFYTLTIAISHGARASFVAALSCTLGIVPHMLASVLGLAAILNSSAVAFEIAKWAGIIYLLYLALGTWKSAEQLTHIAASKEQSLRKIAAKAFLVTTLNPKISVFFLAFLPQFVPPHSPSPVAQMLLLGVTYMLITLLVFTSYGLLANRLRRFILNSPRTLKGIQRSMAGAFIVFGIKLALAGR